MIDLGSLLGPGSAGGATAVPASALSVLASSMPAALPSGEGSALPDFLSQLQQALGLAGSGHTLGGWTDLRPAPDAGSQPGGPPPLSELGSEVVALLVALGLTTAPQPQPAPGADAAGGGAALSSGSDVAAATFPVAVLASGNAATGPASGVSGQTPAAPGASAQPSAAAPLPPAAATTTALPLEPGASATTVTGDLAAQRAGTASGDPPAAVTQPAGGESGSASAGSTAGTTIPPPPDAARPPAPPAISPAFASPINQGVALGAAHLVVTSPGADGASQSSTGQSTTGVPERGRLEPAGQAQQAAEANPPPTAATGPQAAPADASGQDAAGRDKRSLEREPGARSTPPPSSTAGAAAQSPASTSALEAPSDATQRPPDVAAQIARHAELYRLPDGRGVRIQLQPEGLGGVDVTVRYGARGGLEMRLTVEHAATGALVQAGLADLRDALQARGIVPEHLVVHVPAAVAPEHGGGPPSHQGGRAEAGLAGFGHESTARQGGGEQLARGRPPAGSVPPAPTSEERLGVGGETYRIDYRV